MGDGLMSQVNKFHLVLPANTQTVHFPSVVASYGINESKLENRL